MDNRSTLEKEGAVQFKADWSRLPADLPPLGRLRLVVRNESAVSELLGTLEGGRIGKSWFTVENEHFHLHLKSEDISEGYFVEKKKEGGGISRSIQLVDRRGEIVLKLFLLDKEGSSPQVREFQKLKEAYAG